MRVLTSACPACSALVGVHTKFMWRIGRFRACPNCGAAWNLDRSLIWSITSTASAFASAASWVFVGVTGATIVFVGCFLILEFVTLLVIRPWTRDANVGP